MRDTNHAQSDTSPSTPIAIVLRGVIGCPSPHHAPQVAGGEPGAVRRGRHLAHRELVAGQYGAGGTVSGQVRTLPSKSAVVSQAPAIDYPDSDSSGPHWLATYTPVCRLDPRPAVRSDYDRLR